MKSTHNINTQIKCHPCPSNEAASGSAAAQVFDPKAMPLLLTEDEVIALLRIPELSKASDYRNVIENLKRIHGLPCIHICKKPLYPIEAVQQWLLDKVENEQRKI